jgi:hypothetical protein
VSQRYVDVLALSGGLAAAQRGEDRHGGEQRAGRVGDLHGWQDRWVVGGAGHRQQAHRGEEVDVVAGLAGGRALLAPSRDGADDDPVVDRPERGVAHPEPV